MLAFVVSFVALATCGGMLAGLLERRLDAARVPLPIRPPRRAAP